MDRLDNPLLSHATQDMLMDIVTNDDGDVYVLHDRPFPENIGWIEFDEETARLDFISAEGRIRFFGMTVPPEVKTQIMKSELALMLEVGTEGEIRNHALTSLVTRKEIGV